MSFIIGLVLFVVVVGIVDARIAWPDSISNEARR